MSTLAIAEEAKVSVPLDRLRWTWEAEDATVRVQLPLDLVARLRRDIESEPRKSSSEVGGVLLGRAGEHGKVEVEDYIWVESDEAAATDADKAKYILDIAALQPLHEARPDLLILGYFRTQLEGALHLRLAETDFVTDHFHDPSNVVLLVRPGEQFKAGFMTWKGSTFLPFSVEDFPFQAEALRSAASVLRDEKLERILAAPAVASEVAPEFEPEVENVAPVSATRFPRKFKIKIKVRSKNSAKQYIKRVAVGFGSLAAAGALSGFAMIDQLLPAPQIEVPVTVASVPLGLQAEAEERGLEVRWNPESKPVATAVKGRLALIEPDGKAEIIPLNGYQLSSGHEELPFGSNAVEVRLEVSDGRGATTRESFSALQLGPELESLIELPAVPVAEAGPDLGGNGNIELVAGNSGKLVRVKK
jgi:hypothetical protein